MNFFALSSILIILSNLFIAFLAFKMSKGRDVSISFSRFCLFIALWGITSFKVAISKSYNEAVFWWQIAYIPVVYIPIAYYDFVSTYIKFKRKSIFFLVNLIALTFIFAIFLNFENVFGELSYKFNQFFYIDWVRQKRIFWLLFYILFYWVFLSYSFFLLVINFLKSRGVRRQQTKYLIIGSIIGWLGPHGQYLAYFGINLYPYSNILIALYPIIICYAIIRYRLLDVTIAITRTSVFVLVYSLVLGLPFVVAYNWQSFLIANMGSNWWLVPLVLSTVLATIGPFVYLFIQRRAENRLLKEQRNYQQTLRNASMGMTRIRNLNKLLSLVVHIVTRTVRLKHGSIYLLNEKTAQFELRAIRDKGNLMPGFSFDSNSALIWNLILQKEPLVYEEVKQKMQDYKDEKLATLEQEMRLIDAAVVVPSFVEEKLLGFIVLGEKLSGKIYSQDDLSVFSVLANQAALAIENAQFYEEIKDTQTQLFQAEKMATIGTMADGLSHQINNRFHALGMIAADSMDALNSLSENSAPEERQKIISQVRYALERVKENVKQGGEIVHSLLKYSRAGEAGFEPIDLDVLVNSSLEMVQYKVKLSQIDLIRDYPKDIPKIKGNLTQLQEVFFNLIDNAYDAIVQRRNELQEPDYRGNVTIEAVSRDSKIEIRFIDNGIGVSEADKERLFTPFFTTKTSSKKGTGLGLYVIHKIIVDNHKGRIFAESEYKTGTAFTIELPSA